MTGNPPTSTTTPQRPRFGLPTRHGSYKWIAALAALIAIARCWTIVGVYNHTTDELAHIAGSVGLYESGRNIYMVEHPTLPRLVVGAALKIAGVQYPKARGLTAVQARPDANVAGAEIAFDGPVDYWTVLAVARRANLLFLALFLLYTYLLGRYLANPLAGVLAVVFLSLDPNVLAHSALVTTDLPAAAGFLAATYHALRFTAHPSWHTTIIAGIALGLAMSCKFTCILLAPAILVLIVIRAFRHRRRGWLGYLITIPLVTFVTLWATYLFNIGRLEDQHLFDDEKTWNRIPQFVKHAPIPMPAMPLGFMFMAAIGKTGFPCYLNGQLDFNGHLAYFPEAIALKTPTAFVLAIPLALIACAVARRRQGMRVLCLLLPPSLLLLTAMFGRLQIGIRHILPILPFLYLLVVFYLPRGRWVLALIPLILLAGIESARAHPDYLPFFNMLAGGPDNGQEYLADSNLDWGQDVARLAAWLKQRNAADYTIKVSGVRVARLVQYLGFDPASRDRDIEQLRQHPHGLLALGINTKLGLEDFKKERDGTVTRGPDYAWVAQFPLVQRIGHSIEVYDLSQKPTAQ
jgi:4-amino-4-deoxy-L-arabinose transferase-like glycosyltransferase